MPVGPTAGPLPKYFKSDMLYAIGGPPDALPPVTRALTVTFPFVLT